MRSGRERKKKLIVAFHFQFSNRAGWNCVSCRQHGLERKRRCGFIPIEERGPARIVWGRKQVTAEECPQSLIAGESLALLEEFFVRRRLEVPESIDTAAKKVDAFVILRDEMEREQRDVKTEH